MSFFKHSMAYSFISLLILSSSVYAVNNQAELEQLRHKIKIQSASINKQNTYLNDLSKQTQKTDREISKVAAQLANTTNLLTNIKQDLSNLIKQEKTLLNDKRKQQNILAAQIETAYLTGENDYLKLLLNQQNSSEVERSLVYYDYLNKARVAAIEEFNHTLAAIDENQLEQQKIKAQLVKIQSFQEQKADTLEQQKHKQKKANINIAAILRNEKQTLTELKLAEEKLKDQINKLRNQQNIQISLAGLRQYKGNLNWPINGKVIHDFNSKRFSDVRWRGMVISAKEGDKVKSVSAGKVVFADWLRGFGMVTIIDHGQGYMSLYGHNQTLLKVSGEKVGKDEVISLAGRSGGQLESGVYFEIRHKGNALNPTLWLKP